MTAPARNGNGYRPAEGPASQQGMRRANLALVLGAVARLGATSRAQLAEATGLTRAAAGSLVSELIDAGLVQEHGVTLEGRVGRPSTVVSLNNRGPAGLGLEIGVEHLGACVIDLSAEVRTRIRVPAANRERDPRAVIEQLARVANSALAQAHELGLDPVGAVVAVPGLVGAASDTVLHAPNLGWHDVDLTGQLSSLLPGLPVEVENEANLGALAELRRGEVGRDFVHVSAEAGIGAALVVDGLLLRGRRGFAGELGHMPVYPDGLPCPCGSHGCLEQYAGEEAVLRNCGFQDAAGDRVAVLVDQAHAAHPAVRRALEQAGRALGIALAGVVNLVDPETVVLGGAYADLAGWLTPGMQTELGARVRIRPWEPAGLVVSGLRREGPVIGAATSVVQRVITDPAYLQERRERREQRV
ncbi:ROK family transcriptional regulator [Actinospica sp.]|uniref:ROK family transcriptional regulator n=1 Tax=Actinospica sp. TaxID=1872142 RepID=UPI002CEA38A4|nr:ROK family transcriptional regulator [Actinospica sp.]HWG22930.1 ROK family transcriptional regulator [Actinospica sp.]